MKGLEQKNAELEKKVELLQGYCNYLMDELVAGSMDWLSYDKWYDTVSHQAINKLSPGDIFKLSKSDEIEWIVLEQQQDGVFCMMKDCLKAKMPFDKNKMGDWKKSSLRDYLNNDWVEENIKEDIIILFERDLMREDGTNKGENSTDYVSLLTCNEYRKYREVISQTSDWYWTITASCAGDSEFVRIVLASGAITDNNAGSSNGGIRPCVKFSPFIAVYKV